MKFSRSDTAVSIIEGKHYDRNSNKMCHTFRNIIADMSFSWKSLEILAICNDTYKGSRAANSCLSAIFPLWLLLSCSLVMLIFIYFRGKTGMDTKTFFSIFISIFSSLATYWTLRFKKREFFHIKNIFGISSFKTTSKKLLLINVLQIINLLFYFLFILGIVIQIIISLINAEYALYHLVISGGRISYSFYQFLFPFHMTFIFASFYCSCSADFEIVKSRLKKINIFEEKGAISNVLQSYGAALDVSTRIEKVFSTSAFFLSIVHYINMFLHINTLLTGSFQNHMFENYFGFTENFISFSALIGFASETPEVIDEIKLNLSKISENNALYGKGLSYKINKRLVNAFITRKTVVFSAWNMVYFRRSLIIASYGTLISYAILLYQY